ncbi:MAG: hypothetical protein LDL13_05555 [Calditerrivibrio sp.]|nr:hypothetical protein [Calditerrivibrio sp.]MCA1980151.1 hypothetical protein [Calditerrivibrio sp.]
MVFKVKKTIVVLASLLFINALIYGLSMSSIEATSGKYAVIIVLSLLIFLNLLSLILNIIVIDGDTITVKSLYGKKNVSILNLQEISFIPLKGRILMMLSDSNGFVFVSSMIDGFDKIAKVIRDNLKSKELIEKIDEIDMGVINSKNRMVIVFLLIFNFLIAGSYIYNFLK